MKRSRTKRRRGRGRRKMKKKRRWFMIFPVRTYIVYGDLGFSTHSCNITILSTMIFFLDQEQNCSISVWLNVPT